MKNKQSKSFQIAFAILLLLGLLVVLILVLMTMVDSIWTDGIDRPDIQKNISCYDHFGNLIEGLNCIEYVDCSRLGWISKNKCSDLVEVKQ